jgi:ABC-type transport system substrate-binding protein
VEVRSLDPAAVVPTNHAEMITVDLLYDSVTVIPTGTAGGGPDSPDTGAATSADTDAGGVRAEPDLAESITPNANATAWTVRLQPRSFSDGSPIRAADVKATYERLARRGSTSLAGVRLEIINGYAEVAAGAATEMSGLRVVDERTLEIGLRETFIQLPELLSSPLYGIVPAAAAAAGDEAFVDPVGSGPYAVADRDDVRTRLERSPSEAGAAVGPDAVELIGFATWDDAYVAFTEGRIDWSLVPSDQLAAATNTYGSDQFAFFGSDLWLGFNLNNPLFADTRFRQAIVQAVDSDKVVADTLPGRWPLRAIVPREVTGYNPDACAGVCEFDPDNARALLAQVYPEGGVPTVILDGYEDPVQRSMLESVRSQLGAAGIPSELRLRPFQEYRAFVTSGQQALFSFGWVGVAPMQDVYLAPLFQSSSPDNVTGFKSANIDNQITIARTNGNEEERAALYEWIERQVLAESTLVPIAQLRTNQVVSQRVQGWATRLDGTFVVGDVWIAG